MNKDGNSFSTCKECHKTESLWNYTTTDHKEGEQLEDRRSVVDSSCNCGDGTDQRVQSLLFFMMMMMMMIINPKIPYSAYSQCGHTRRHFEPVSIFAPWMCKIHFIEPSTCTYVSPPPRFRPQTPLHTLLQMAAHKERYTFSVKLSGFVYGVTSYLTQKISKLRSFDRQ